MLRCIRFFCCSGIPKSTSSDYYFDPRVITFGARQFDSKKTQNMVSDEKFDEMSQEMIKTGGSNLKILYFLIMAITIGYFGWWLIKMTLAVTGTHTFSRTTAIISLILAIVVNIILNRIWKFYMKKATKEIQEMFDQQNRAVYGSKGIHWGTKQTLAYIHIRIDTAQGGYQQPAEFKV